MYGWINSGKIIDARVTKVDRVDRERFRIRPKASTSYIDIAHVEWTPSSASAIAVVGRRGIAKAAARWGQFEGDNPAALIGREFLLNVHTQARAHSQARGVPFLLATAALALVLSACPIRVGGMEESKTAHRWRGDRYDVLVGLAIILSATSLFAWFSVQTTSLKAIAIANLLGGGFSLFLLLWFLVRMFIPAAGRGTAN